MKAAGLRTCREAARSPAEPERGQVRAAARTSGVQPAPGPPDPAVARSWSPAGPLCGFSGKLFSLPRDVSSFTSTAPSALGAPSPAAAPRGSGRLQKLPRRSRDCTAASASPQPALGAARGAPPQTWQLPLSL